MDKNKLVLKSILFHYTDNDESLQSVCSVDKQTVLATITGIDQQLSLGTEVHLLRSVSAHQSIISNGRRLARSCAECRYEIKLPIG